MGLSTAALGMRAHSGWAAMVVIAGSVDSPSIVDRRIIQLHNPTTPGSKQPYHAAEPLALNDAEILISRCVDETNRSAYAGLSAAIADSKREGYRIAGCGILLASGRILPDLKGILASHAFIHAAEGELFRDALQEAARACRLPVTGIRQRELATRVSEVLGKSPDQLRDYLSAIGRSLGPPWREDQKCATLAAWLALAESSKAVSAAR